MLFSSKPKIKSDVEELDLDMSSETAETSETADEDSSYKEWVIEEQHVESVLKLWIDLKRAEEQGSEIDEIMPRYYFWKKIEELIPETKAYEDIEFDCDRDILKPYVYVN